MRLLPNIPPGHSAVAPTAGSSSAALNTPAITNTLDASAARFGSTPTGRLRAGVERRFRRMFETHDRIRAKLLAVHSTKQR